LYNIDEGRQVMNELKCVTCQHSLRDTGKISRDCQYAYCTKCHTKYAVSPATDAFGNPITDAEGRVHYYLEPILNNNNSSKQYQNSSSAFVCSPEVIEEYTEIKYHIHRCKSVNEFLKFLKK
jgi:hypothetical protein